jgi:hypothetical protein
VEHPKDVGDRSTLAIVAALREHGFGVYLPFAVYCRETSGVYLVPIGKLPGTTSAALRADPPRNNQFKRIRRAADYEIGRVAIERLRDSSGAR